MLLTLQVLRLNTSRTGFEIKILQQLGVAVTYTHETVILRRTCNDHTKHWKCEQTSIVDTKSRYQAATTRILLPPNGTGNMSLRDSEFNIRTLWPAIYIYSKSFNNKSEYKGLVTCGTRNHAQWPLSQLLLLYLYIVNIPPNTSLPFHFHPNAVWSDSVMNLKLECISTYAFQATIPLYLISFHVNYDNGLWYGCRMRMLKLAEDSPSKQ